MTIDSNEPSIEVSEPANPKFLDTRGQLPPMWNRRAIFFANLLSIFFGNEAQTRVLGREVGELDSYSARLIPILNLLFRPSEDQGSNDASSTSHARENLLVVERKPDLALCRYLEEDLGLSLPRIVVLSHDDYLKWGRRLDTEDLSQHQASELTELFGDVADSETIWMDGYVTDNVVMRFADHFGCQTISSPAASQAGNNKLLLHQFLASAGLPTLDTELANDAEDVPDCAQRLNRKGYTAAVVRAQIGASGVGMLRIEDLQSLDTGILVPPYFFHEGPCLVQGLLAAEVMGIQKIRSPSTQLFLDEEYVHAFDLTEQILSSDNIHEGNESPPPYLEDLPSLRDETMRQAQIVSGWLHRTGYRGTASIDWLVVQRADLNGNILDPEVYVCEINARVTGATYPSLLAKHFHPSGAWLLRNLRLNLPTTASALLQTFDRAGHLFRAGRQAGILPLNFNFGDDGLVHKGQFLCIGDNSQHCHRLLRLAQEDLPGSWNADRD